MWSYPLWRVFVKKRAAQSIFVRKLDFGKYCNLRVLECVLGEMGSSSTFFHVLQGLSLLPFSSLNLFEDCTLFSLCSLWRMPPPRENTNSSLISFICRQFV